MQKYNWRLGKLALGVVGILVECTFDMVTSKS